MKLACSLPFKGGMSQWDKHKTPMKLSVNAGTSSNFLYHLAYIPSPLNKFCCFTKFHLCPGSNNMAWYISHKCLFVGWEFKRYNKLQGYSPWNWRSVFSVTAGKEKKSQEETWCKPAPWLLCVFKRHIVDTLPRITVSLEFAVNSAASPLGLQKRVYS